MLNLRLVSWRERGVEVLGDILLDFSFVPAGFCRTGWKCFRIPRAPECGLERAHARIGFMLFVASE